MRVLRWFVECLAMIGIMTLPIIEITWPVWPVCIGYFILNYFNKSYTN